MGCSCSSAIISEFKLKYNLIKNNFQVRCISELPFGRLLTCGGDGKFNIRDNKEHKKIEKSIQAHRNQIFSLIEMSTNNLISIGDDNYIKSWDIGADFKLLEEIKVAESKPLCGKKIHSSRFGVGLQEGIAVYRTNELEQIYFVKMSSSVDIIFVLKDERIACNNFFKIAFWKYESNPEKDENYLHYLEGHEKKVCSILQMRDGTFLSGSEDKKIYVWDIKDYFRIKEMDGHQGPVISMLQLDEGNLVTGDKYCLILIWDLDLENIIQTLIEEGSILDFYQLSNSDLCTISSADEVKIWSYHKDVNEE